MELVSRLRWIIIITIALVFLVLVGWGLYSIASNLFNPDRTEETKQVEVANQQTEDVLSASYAQFTADGPIVASQDHRSYKIEVNKNLVTIKLYSGYGTQLLTEKSYTNNVEAYDAFLKSLVNIGVTERREGTDEDQDYEEQGVCPQGRRYIVSIDSLRRWSASCSSKIGTAGFSMNAIQSLFERQVPDFRDVTRGTRL